MTVRSGIRQDQTFATTLAGDESVAILIWYNGTASAATVESAAATMVLTEGGAASAHSDGATAAGTITYSETTANTMQKLADLIETVDGWHAQLVAALPGDNSTNMLITASQSCATAAGAEIKNDHGDAAAVRVCIGPEAQSTQGDGSSMPAAARTSGGNLSAVDAGDIHTQVNAGYAHDVAASDTLSEIIYATFTGSNGTNNSTPSMAFYSISKGGVQTQVHPSVVGVDGTESVIDRTAPNMAIRGKMGQRLVASMDIASADVLATQITGHYGDGPYRS